MQVVLCLHPSLSADRKFCLRWETNTGYAFGDAADIKPAQKGWKYERTCRGEEAARTAKTPTRQLLVSEKISQSLPSTLVSKYLVTMVYTERVSN